MHALGQVVAERAWTGGTQTTTYHHRDHLGSLRVATDAAGALADAHDYYPFGGEMGPVASSSRRKFTGHERDEETGLDYMLARYYPASMGRFLSVDPGTDIRPEDPQSWNLYGYVRNNPVNATDPDGKEVPESCAKNNSCSITVKVNVVWDSAAKLTAQQMQDFPKTQLDKAITDFENSNIKLDVKCTQGRIVRNDAGDVSGVNGLDKGALNVVVSNTTPRPDVVGLAVVSQGYALAFVNALQVHTWNIWAWSGNTTEHEMGHHFEGDMSMKRTIFSNLFTDTVLNARLANQGGGFSVGALKMGLIPAWFAFETSEQR